MKHIAIALAFVLLLICAPHDASAQAATPVLRWKAVIDNLRNKSTTNAELDRITTRLLPIASPGTDTSAWTATQKATVMLEFSRLMYRSQLVGAAGDQERAAAAIASAINAAAADLD